MKKYKWLTNIKYDDAHPLTKKKIIDWVCTTGYIEGLVRKRTSPLDINLIDDYIQECWLQILEVPEEKLVNIYKKGKGVFTNYIKAIVNNNVCSVSSPLYKRIKMPYKTEVYLDSGSWQNINNGIGNITTSEIYPIKTYDKTRYTIEKCVENKQEHFDGSILEED